MTTKMHFTEEAGSESLKVKETAFFINLLLETGGITYAPQFGLSVMNTEPEAVDTLLNTMIEKENTTALSVKVTAITIGADFILDDTEYPELDKLLGDHVAAAPLLVPTNK